MSGKKVVGQANKTGMAILMFPPATLEAIEHRKE